MDKKTVRKELKKLSLKRTKEEERAIREKKEGEARKEPMPKLFPSLSRKKHLIAILLIALTGFLVYANSFHNEFLWDDEGLIEKNVYIKNVKYLPRLFVTHIFQGVGGKSNFYRPIQSLTYMLDYSIWKLKPLGYHLTNTILHILVAILIYVFLQGLVGTRKAEQEIAGNISTNKLTNKLTNYLTIPSLTALFFLIHPIHTEAVTYISGRADSLASIFCLLSLILFLKYTNLKKLPYYLCSLFSFILALLSKEWSLILPFTLILTDSFFGSKERKINQRIKDYLPYFVIFVLYILLRVTVLKFSEEIFVSEQPSFYIRTITFLKVLILYLALLIFPHNLHMERSIPFIKSFFTPQVLGSILLLILITISIITICKKTKRKELIFAPLWFLLLLFPQSNIIPINANMAEHFIYLPSLGFFLLLAMGIVEVTTRYQKGLVKGILFLSLLLFLFYSVSTIKQNLYWKEPFIFYQKTLKQNPNSPRLHSNLGNVYQEKGLHDQAITECQKAIQLKPDYANAYNNLGNVYSKKGIYDQAISEYQKALQLNPDFADAYNNLGVVYVRKGFYDRAISEYQKALQLNPDFADAYYNLGNVYSKKGFYDQAISEYQKALQLNPDFVEVHNNLGNVYNKKGFYDQAISEYQKAIQLNPDFVEVHNNLGVVYANKGLYDQAISECQKAIQLKPDYAGAHNNLGSVYQEKGFYDQAISEYQKAIQLNPDYADAHNNLGVVYANKGLYDQAISECQKAIQLKPDYAGAHNNLGNVYQEKGIYDQAISEYQKALQLNPDFADAHNNLGSTYTKMGQYQKAREECEKALKIDPDLKEAQDNLRKLEETGY